MLSSLLFVSRAKIDIGCGLAGKYRCSGISSCRKSARDLKSDPLCMLLISNSSITDKYKRNIHKMLQFSTWKCILQSWITDKVSTIPQRHEVTLKHASLCYLTCMLHSEDDLFHRKWINDVTPQSLSCIDINRSVSRDNSFSFFLLLFVMRSWKSMNVFSWKTQMIVALSSVGTKISHVEALWNKEQINESASATTADRTVQLMNAAQEGHG